MYDSPTKFYTSNFNFCVKMGINGPLYREICLNGVLTVMRFDILMSFWGPFQHLTPFAFNVWDLIHYLRPFSAFETLFIQHLRPYLLFETLFSIWLPFGGHLRPYSLLETLFSIRHPFHSTFETLFIIWGPFQHLRPFSFNIWDLIGYLRNWDPFQHLTPFWRIWPPIFKS